jgi:hypothetical protein
LFDVEDLGHRTFTVAEKWAARPITCLRNAACSLGFGRGELRPSQGTGRGRIVTS